MIARSLVFSLVCLVSCLDRAVAQSPQVSVPTAAPALESPITVTLVTFGLGEEIFERFGHNALWFHDSSTRPDVAYHWGLFGFTEPDFLQRFLTGDTKYWMGAVDAQQLIESERSRGRPITLQRLNLTPAQAFTLREFVQWNALEANKFYRYDYFGDNCSTRLRDALDRALGGALRRATDTARTTLTYRRESVRLTDGLRPVQTGIDIALGRPADVPLTKWESFFIPMRLRDAVRVMRIPGPDGVDVPLVAREESVSLAPNTTPVPELDGVPVRAPRNAVLGLVLGALVVVLRVMALSRRSAAWGLALFGSAWSLLCGVLGVLLLLAWMATKHVYWASNETVLLLTPFSLALVMLIPAAVLSGRHERAARMLASVVALLGLIAAVLAIVPGGQENLAVVALFLPVHLALAWALALPRLVATR